MRQACQGDRAGPPRHHRGDCLAGQRHTSRPKVQSPPCGAGVAELWLGALAVLNPLTAPVAQPLFWQCVRLAACTAGRRIAAHVQPCACLWDLQLPGDDLCKRCYFAALWRLQEDVDAGLLSSAQLETLIYANMRFNGPRLPGSGEACSRVMDGAEGQPDMRPPCAQRARVLLTPHAWSTLPCCQRL